jgi:hypothetical protein
MYLRIIHVPPPQKKSILGPLCVFVVIIILIAALSDQDKKDNPNSQANPDNQQLPATENAAPPDTDIRPAPYTVERNRDDAAR